jgi:hypothetical protein
LDKNLLQVFVRDYPPGWISGWTVKFLFGQVDLISGFSQSPTRILSNLDLKFGQVFIRDYLLDSPDRISGWTVQFLFDR